jgi:hypothetical protein
VHAYINDISSAIIGAAIEVHRILGPGLLESADEQSLAHEFSLRQIRSSAKSRWLSTTKACDWTFGWIFSSQIPSWSKSKAIKALLPIQQAQLLSYLKLGGWKLGLLMNFHPLCCVRASSALCSD